MRATQMLLVCLGTVLLPLVGHAAPLPAPKIEKISDRVYALLGPLGLPDKTNQGYMVNSTLIIGERGVIVVDTGFTDKIGQHLAKTIKTITNKPVTHIINTHHHGDHTLGNIAFAGAEVISSAQCREALDNTAMEWLGFVENMTGMKFPDTRPVLASKTYPEDSRTEVTLQGVKLQLWVPPRSHTVGDLMVYLPQEQVLIAGDIVVHKESPQFRDGFVKSWLGTLTAIQQTEFKLIIPGHGPLLNKAQFTQYPAMLAKLYQGVEAGYKKGLTDSEVRQSLDLSEWRKLHNFDDFMGGNINRTYLEIEQANF